MWISVKEKLPKQTNIGYSKNVFMWHSHYGAIIGYRFKETWEAEFEFHMDENLDDIQGITHWAPIIPPIDPE